MISTEARASASGASTSRQSNRKCAGQLTFDLGGSAEYDAAGYFVCDKGGRVGCFYETAHQRQERLATMRRQRRPQRVCQEGVYVVLSRSECAVSKKDSALERRMRRNIDCTEAATKIQRTYRAYRAVKALALLEQHIRTTFDPPHDARNALSYLRARSAELGALRAFLAATPHTSDHPRVRRASRRVEEALQHAMNQAERAEKEREFRTVVVHVHDTGTSTARTCWPRPGSGESMSSPKYAARWKTQTSNDSHSHSSYGTNIWSVSEVLSPADDELDLRSTDVYTQEDGGVSEARRVARVALLSGGSPQYQEWIARVQAATLPHRSHRHLTVSKAPTLLTISEVVEGRKS